MYISKIRQFLTPPIFEDEDKTRTAGLLNIILLATMALNVVYSPILAVMLPNPIPSLVADNILLLLQIGLFILMRRGYVQVASNLLLFLIWIYITVVLYTFGGVRSPVFNGYIFLVLMAGLLLGGRGVIAFTGLSVVSSLAILLVELGGVLPPSFVPLTPAYVWSGVFMVLIATAILLYLAFRSIENALERAQRNEAHARKAQAQLVNAIESLTEAFALYDADDRLVLCNSKYREFYDLSADLLVPGARFEDHIRTSVYRGQVAEAIGREEAWIQERVKQHQNPQGVYLQQLGNGRWLQISERKTGEGGIVGVRTDITERVQAEKALRESEKRLIEAQYIAKMGDFTWDVETGEVTWSKALFDLLRYDKSETIDYARVNAEIHHPDDLEGVTQWLNDCIASGKAELTPNEYRLIRKDGEVIYVRTVGVIERKQGKSTKVFATLQDITERKQAEEALQESEKKYRLLFEKMMNGFALHEIVVNEKDKPVDYVFLEANAAFEEFTGLKRNQIIGNKVTEVIPGIEKDPADWIGRYGKVALTGQEIRFDQYAEPLDKWYSVLAFSPQKGQFATVFGDITERKRAEEALRESEERFRLAFENANIGVCLVDLDGRFMQVNNQLCQIFGYNREELESMTVNDIAHPEDLDISPQFIQRAASGETEHTQFEKRYIHKQGHIVWGQVSSSLVRDVQDIPLYFISHIQDITELKRAEEALRASEEKYRTLFEHLPIPVFTKNYEGVYTSCNAENRKYWAVNPIGRTDAELLDHETATALREVDLQIMETGAALAVEEDLANTPLGERQVLSHKVPLRDGSGNIVGVLGASLDITDQKQLEEQLRQAQKMEAVGRLTAGIAHDFNNLLTAINGFATLIQNELSSNDPIKEMIDKISNSGQRAADLVRQLMAFSRKQIVEPKLLNLNKVVNQIDKMLRHIIGEHIELRTILSPELWPVKVDPVQFEQVIVNLAVNARDAMPDGGKLTIETSNVVLTENYVTKHFQAEAGDYVLLAVSDTGSGISKEVQAHIFEPFFTTKEMGHGTGLGLATVYGIVKQSDGDIQVYSEEGQGTTFKIYLPRAEENRSPQPRLEVPAQLPAGTETVLLVEDEEGIRNLASKVLQTQGYTVLEAQNGREALQLVADHTGPIHLLLTDVVMPELSGKALAEQLSQSRPDLKVLYMSGYTDDAIAHHGVLDSGTAFLQKPFTLTALAHKVRQVLEDVPSK